MMMMKIFLINLWQGVLETLIDAFTKHIFYTMCFVGLYFIAAFSMRTEYVVDVCLAFTLVASVYWLYSLFRYSDSIVESSVGIASTLRFSLMALASACFWGILIDTGLNWFGGSFIFFVAYTLSIGAYVHEKNVKALTLN